MRRLLRPAWPWIALLAAGALVLVLDGVARLNPQETRIYEMDAGGNITHRSVYESMAPTSLRWGGLLLAAIGTAGLLARRRLDPL